VYPVPREEAPNRPCKRDIQGDSVPVVQGYTIEDAKENPNPYYSDRVATTNRASILVLTAYNVPPSIVRD